jgi:rubrerythrin
MTESTSTAEDAARIDPGKVVYDHEGNELGVVADMTSQGFEVSIIDDIESVDEDGYAENIDHPDVEGEQSAKTNEADIHGSEQEENPGQDFGEGYIMWRCDDCGEMGELEDGLPSECPDCGSEEVYKWRED